MMQKTQSRTALRTINLLKNAVDDAVPSYQVKFVMMMRNSPTVSLSSR